MYALFTQDIPKKYPYIRFSSIKKNLAKTQNTFLDIKSKAF